MGMQEYIVTTHKRSVAEMAAEFGFNAICVTIPKIDINNVVWNLAIKKDEQLVVLYGDRHAFADVLQEKFPEESFWCSEIVNEVACGEPSPARKEMNKVFTDIPIKDILKLLKNKEQENSKA